MMEYANIEEIRKALRIRNTPNGVILASVPTIEIEAALDNAKEQDVVKVTRCEKCFWCIQSRGIREPLCTVPGRPAHHTTLDGYCSNGKEKNGNG